MLIERMNQTPRCPWIENKEMHMGSVLLIIVVLLLIGALPTWPHSRKWGYGPSGGLGAVFVVLVILLLFTNVFSRTSSL
jgi:hypothetical protein